MCHNLESAALCIHDTNDVWSALIESINLSPISSPRVVAYLSKYIGWDELTRSVIGSGGSVGRSFWLRGVRPRGQYKTYGMWNTERFPRTATLAPP